MPLAYPCFQANQGSQGRLPPESKRLVGGQAKLVDPSGRRPLGQDVHGVHVLQLSHLAYGACHKELLRGHTWFRVNEGDRKNQTRHCPRFPAPEWNSDLIISIL
jgi:hypothetical protein